MDAVKTRFYHTLHILNHPTFNSRECRCDTGVRDLRDRPTLMKERFESKHLVRLADFLGTQGKFPVM